MYPVSYLKINKEALRRKLTTPQLPNTGPIFGNGGSHGRITGLPAHFGPSAFSGYPPRRQRGTAPPPSPRDWAAIPQNRNAIFLVGGFHIAAITAIGFTLPDHGDSPTLRMGGYRPWAQRHNISLAVTYGSIPARCMVVSHVDRSANRTRIRRGLRIRKWNLSDSGLPPPTSNALVLPRRQSEI